MKKLEEIVSTDSRFRVEFFKRDDDTYGYHEFRNAAGAECPSWLQHAKSTSRFESHEVALHEAQQRLEWLKKEMAWPAKDREAIAASEYMADWMVCPFCGVRFSFLDRNRWAGGRHLTCGQRIVKTAFV